MILLFIQLGVNTVTIQPNVDNSFAVTTPLSNPSLTNNRCLFSTLELIHSSAASFFISTVALGAGSNTIDFSGIGLEGVCSFATFNEA